MKKITFNIWDMIAIEWESPLWSLVPDFAIKYHYFLAPPEKITGKIDKIIVKNSPPPLSFLKTIKYASERFGIGDGIIEIGHQHGRMRWKTWISGLDTNEVHVYYQFPLINRLQYPWIFFPDLLICMHTVQPLLEYKLIDKNVIVLHSAALSKSGMGVLLAGRGGVKKTTYMMKMLKSGWKYVSDDMVLLKGKKMLAFPLGDTFFDYFYLKESDENVDLKAMLGAFLHVRKNKKLSFAIEKESPINKLNLLIGWNNEYTRVEDEGIVNESIIERVLAENRIERLNFVDAEEVLGRFMLQFNQVFGTDNWNIFWEKQYNILRNNLSGLPYRVILSGKGNVDLTSLLL
jgi:hypothetical protein